MATAEKANKAVERLAETTRDSYQTVVDHAVGLQERNVRFAQGMVDGTIKELRYQAESNRSAIGELFERAEDQRDAYHALVEQSLEAYVDLAYAPFTYYKEGLEAARKATR
jgi:transcriptional regulator of heat shock response